jgi:hypothetical protein
VTIFCIIDIVGEDRHPLGVEVLDISSVHSISELISI